MLACELLGVMSKAVWAIEVNEINKNIFHISILRKPERSLKHGNYLYLLMFLILLLG